MRILVVEDDDSIAELTELALAPEGHEIVRAANGAVALDLLEGTTVDLVLLDVRMPVMDGWTFARAYGERPGPHAPIVVMTAAAGAARRAAEIGCAGFLAKPFDLDDLYAVVHRAGGAAAT